MATFIDLSFFHGIYPILIFLLVFGVVYTLLQSIKVLGTNKSIHGIIAIVAAIFVAISNEISQVIMMIIPWFTLIAILLILMIIGFGAMGSDYEGFLETLGTESASGSGTIIKWTVVVLGVIIIGGAISTVYGQDQLAITDKNAQDTSNSGRLDKVEMGNVDLYDNNINTIGNNNNNNDPLNSDSGNFEDNMGAALYHPRMLGFILLMLIGVLTTAMLTQ